LFVVDLKKEGYPLFHHEKLDVYRIALEFNGWAGALLDDRLATCKLSVAKQLDRAATSIPLNIAEGNGKRSRRDQARFLDIARGSALECAACLDTLVVRRALGAEEIVAGKERLERVVGMLFKMTWSIVGSKTDDDHDDGYDYATDHDHDNDHDPENGRRARFARGDRRGR
jgi:four helix bundle protein